MNKAGWEVKTLNDVCIVERGSSPRPIKSFFTTNADGVNWIKIGDTEQDGRYVYSTAQKITPEGAKQSRYVKEGDFILTNSMSFGRPYIMKTSGYIHDGWFVFRLKESLDADYFFHLLSSQLVQDQFTSLASGAIVKNISGDLVKKTKLPIPPLLEQQRIVGILDAAFEGIAHARANAEQNLQNARALFESHLQSVFTQRGEGWVEKRIEEVGSTQTGSTPKTSDKKNFGDFIPFVKPADFNTDGSLNYENDGLSELGFAQARKVAEGSVLMVCIGATIGKCGWCDRDITTNQQTNTLTPTKGVSYKFIYYQMLTEDFQRRVIHGSGQATLPIINKSKWSALAVWLPPTLDEQEQIVAKLDSLREETQRLTALYQRKLAALDELKKALLHQAFSGML